MSHFLDRLTFFRHKHEPFANGHGVLTEEDRKWENAYRSRWSHDKIARSTHGVNCTGSCSWKIYVKNGIITWETQQTDYPRTRPDLPNHEPRGCPRGASYSWYVYSAQRIKYPMMRGALAELWREARKTKDPIEAWQWIVEDPERSKSYKSQRGLGGFVRSNWDEAYEMVAAANCYTIKKYGPDRVIGFSPIPAMSMVSYASGARYLGLIGGVPLSFYDWYCDLPPASPQTWGEQTDVAESADWYNSNYLLVWGSNIPMTRTPDAHFYTEVRYKGTKTVAVSSDFGENGQVQRHLALAAPRHGCRAGDGDGARYPQRIPYRQSIRLFSRLLPPPDRYAGAGVPERRRRRLPPGIHFARVAVERQFRRREKPRLESAGVERENRQPDAAQRLHRLPLGRQRQVESGNQGAG